MRTSIALVSLATVAAATAWFLRDSTDSSALHDPVLLAEGRMLFEQHCAACHDVGASDFAPSLVGLLGRQAGTARFANSPALKAAGFAWDADRLDAFLLDPRGVIPGNQMAFFGLDDPEERAAIIAYVASL